jgi:hypothetical protein
VIPTIIEYLFILLVVMALFPLGFNLLAKLPFLGIEVAGYIPSAIFIVLVFLIGIATSLILYSLIKVSKFKFAISILFVLGYGSSFLSFYLADLLVAGVHLHIVTKFIFALFGNVSNALPTLMEMSLEQVRPSRDKPKDN